MVNSRIIWGKAIGHMGDKKPRNMKMRYNVIGEVCICREMISLNH